MTVPATALGTPNGYGLVVRAADGSLASSDGNKPIVDTPNQAGVYAACALPRTTRAMAANQTYFQRFTVPSSLAPFAVGHFAFVLTTAATGNDSIDVGIYSTGGARLASTGTTAGLVNGATGLVSVPLTAILIPGSYYAALAYGAINVAAASLAATDLSSFAVATMFGTTLATGVEQGFFGQAPALPASIAPAGSASASVPAFALTP